MATTGFEPFAGHAGGEGDGVLFGDADVEVALGVALGEAHQPEPSRMAGVMAISRGSRGGGVAEPVAEDLGVAGAGGLLFVDGAGAAVEGGDAVVFGGGVFGGGVAVALLGDEVQQPRHGHLFHVLERGERPSRSWPSMGPM
jgi:hypothetical protein